MLTRLFPAPWLSIFLVLFWLLLQNSVSAGQIILGIILATVIPWYSSRPEGEVTHLHKPFRALQYFLLLLVDIVISNFKIAALILNFRSRTSPALVEYRLDIEGAIPITILAATISLTPGTISAEISQDKKTLLIHALNVSDTDAMIADIKHKYERRLKEIFQC